MKSVFGVIGAIIPIVYCGSLLYYFVDLAGSVAEAKADGLGPTIVGLGVVGLLFCIPLLTKVVRMFAGMRPPGSGGTPAQESAFDADAVVARYKARGSVDDAPHPAAAARPVAQTGRSFGRRTNRTG